MEEIRLQKFLANCGIASRRKCEEYILQGKVKVNEKIVTELEKGNLSLEDSLNKFEEGMNLSKDCSKLLEDAEKRITIILEKDGELKEENFTVEE